jgi:hypothetical protein
MPSPRPFSSTTLFESPSHSATYKFKAGNEKGHNSSIVGTTRFSFSFKRTKAVISQQFQEDAEVYFGNGAILVPETCRNCGGKDQMNLMYRRCPKEAILSFSGNQACQAPGSRASSAALFSDPRIVTSGFCVSPYCATASIAHFRLLLYLARTPFPASAIALLQLPLTGIRYEMHGGAWSVISSATCLLMSQVSSAWARL